MAIINFPDSPVSGQIFSGSMVNWKWNGTTWSTISSRNAGVSADSIWDTKGDLVVGTGSNAASKLAAGSSDGLMLSSDSSTSTGLKWVEPFELNSLFHVWHVQSWTVDSTNTTPQSYNTGTASAQGTATSVSPTASRLRNVSYVSTATTGSDAGVKSNTSNGHISHDFRLLVWAGLDTLTNVRYVVGITDVNIQAYDDGNNGDSAWFRYSTNASDTNWMCLTSNSAAGGPTITDTGVAVTTGTKIFEIHKTASEVKFFLDNVLVATHTTDIPVVDDTFAMVAGLARNLTNASTTVHFVQCLLLAKVP
jgi:hypothetical protein